MRIAFTVPGPPVPCARARVVKQPGKKARGITPKKTERYQTHVAWCARAALLARGPALMPGPDGGLMRLAWPLDAKAYGMRLRLYREADRGDFDNYAKNFADSCEGILYGNDKRITYGEVEMFIDRVNPRAEVEIWVR